MKRILSGGADVIWVINKYNLHKELFSSFASSSGAFAHLTVVVFVVVIVESVVLSTGWIAAAASAAADSRALSSYWRNNLAPQQCAFTVQH